MGGRVVKGPDLSTRIGTLQLRNPLIAASGCFGYGTEVPDLVPAATFGAIVTKTILEKPRPGNPPGRLAETPSGLLNSIGLEGIGIDRFIAEKLPLLESAGTRIVVSVGGHDGEEYARVAARLEGIDRVDAIELNISCPNVDGGIDLSTDPALAGATVAAVRRVTGKPLWAKLTPNVTRIGSVGKACQEAGADAICAVNTFTGMAVDVETRRAFLPRGLGGVSGPAIRPLALARVWELVRSVSIPVVGIGGIFTARDALEFLITGARAVQLGTVLFVDPTAPRSIVHDLAEHLAARGIGSIEALIGTLQVGSPGGAP